MRLIPRGLAGSVGEEEVLVQQAASGDEAAFELLVRRHAEAAWRLARALLPDDFTAEEAVQETFIKAHRGLRSFGGRSSFRTWLLAICRRACLDLIRSRRIEFLPLDALGERRTEDGQSDLRLALQEAMVRLPEEERQAFLLVHVLSYSREEAAQICGVPASTMRSRVTRARQHLADRLDSSGGGGRDR